jgi:prepilin-type N-terminal cleavage/methylation domain-containing protein
MSARHAGFTFVELLVVVTIVGLLSSIAVPKYRAMKQRAQATNVLGDMQVVRVAVMNYYADYNAFPEDADAGTAPPNLEKYLPVGFGFKRDTWSMDYDHVSGGGVNGDLVGVSAATLDDELGRIVMAMLGTNATIMINGRLTFFISGM